MKFLFLFLFLLVTIPAYGQSLELRWNDNSNNEDGFRIERKTGQTGTFAPVKEVVTDETTFVDPVPDEQTYCYRVKAFNASGESPYSNEACATILKVPIAPSGTVIIVIIPPTP